MIGYTCPLCGKDSICKKEMAGENGYEFYFCDTYHTKFFLGDEIINLRDDTEKQEKLMDLIVEQLVHKPCYIENGTNRYWHFFYQPGYEIKDNEPPYYINLADHINSYPADTIERVNRGLINLSLFYPHYGDIVDINNETQRLIFERTENNSFGMYGFADFFEELGYLKKVRMSAKKYILTASAWQRIDELRKNELTLKQAFIAMRFGDETRFIREAFRKAIRESGYSERFIDEKEHNNQIVPEILYEIGRSKFMVVDISFPNYGAYYEAGYGQALGKEVIICCRKEEFDSLEKKPHFDIAQKSMIVWTDTADLVARLKRRIEATVKVLPLSRTILIW